MKTKFKIFISGILIFIASSFTACKDDDKDEITAKPDVEFVVLSAANQLSFYNSTDVRSVLRSVTVTGLAAAAGSTPAETLLAIDYRPATGQLYGISTLSRLYSINITTGAPTLIGTGPINPALSGNIAGFDFNPTVDRIRVVTSTGQNLRINPENASVTVDGTINGGITPAISAVAYTNNTAGASTTTLYDLDIENQKLYKQDAPNDGTLIEVGSLDLPGASLGNAGFDIAPDGTTALAVIRNGSNSALYQINLDNGKATTLGSISNTATNATSFYVGIAIAPRAVAYAADETNNLLIFNPTDISTQPIISKPITGLVLNENVVGLDLRPANGQLYALGSLGGIYTINMGSGAATKVSSLTIPLLGTQFAFEVTPLSTDPTIKIISNTGQNLKHNFSTNLTTLEGNVSPATAVITGAAFSNNFATSSTSTLYVVDATLDKLYTINAATGVLTSVGAATVRLGNGIDVSNAHGFDISSTTGTAYGLFSVVTQTTPSVVTATKIYAINLTAGTASEIVTFPTPVRAFALGLGF